MFLDKNLTPSYKNCKSHLILVYFWRKLVKLWYISEDVLKLLNIFSIPEFQFVCYLLISYCFASKSRRWLLFPITDGDDNAFDMMEVSPIGELHIRSSRNGWFALWRRVICFCTCPQSWEDASSNILRNSPRIVNFYWQESILTRCFKPKLDGC